MQQHFGPVTTELYWYAKYFMCMGSALWLMGRILKSVVKVLDDRTEGIVKRINEGLLDALHLEFVKRDKSIRHLNRRVNNLAIVGRELAAIGLFPTIPPSQAEKDRLLEDFKRIFDDMDDLQIT